MFFNISRVQLNHTNMSDPVFVTSKEAADLLGVPLRTVYLWSSIGLLQYWITADGQHCVFMESVIQLMETRAAQNKRVSLEPDTHESRMKVLIVEDDPNLIRLYRMQMALWPMEVIPSFAANGYQGLAIVGCKQHHLMITDLAMSGLNGIQMLKILKGMPEMDSTEIVIVTGMCEKELLAQNETLHGIKIFTKPVPFAKLEKIAIEIAGKFGFLPLKK